MYILWLEFTHLLNML